MPRFKDADWDLPKDQTGTIKSWDFVRLALLMDIRDELRAIRSSLSVLRCRNFLRVPAKLDRIGRNTERKQRAKAKAQT